MILWVSPFFQHVKRYEAAFAGVPDYIHDAIVRAYVRTAAFQPIEDATLDHIVLPWIEPGGKAAFYRQIAQANASYTDEVQPYYAHISRPVLILWGREDSWIPLERGEVLRGMIPGARWHVIPEAGHLVIEEKPDQLVQAIRPFLKEQARH
jgi:pimeloyl-ACP methyl ester carboxylesterase